MQEKVEKILEIWHKHFSDEERQYAEFESSDIEYFVGCMLYNHFDFEKALANVKTMDLSYDFLSSCGDEYDEIQTIIRSIDSDDEIKNLEFLQKFIATSKSKYQASELYLLNRLEYHINAIAERYKNNIDVKNIDFENPLLRK